jgi:hypothetical protein
MYAEQLTLQFVQDKCNCTMGYVTWDGKYLVCNHNVKHLLSKCMKPKDKTRLKTTNRMKANPQSRLFVTRDTIDTE